MTTILCFGDSITWGYDPATGQRLPREQRWPVVLQRALGEAFEVVAEGLVNRTTNLDDPVCPDRNGLAQLPACLESHKPISVVLVMLGTNDFKARFGRSASDIAESAARLAGAARASACGPAGSQPRVILLTPPAPDPAEKYREMFAGAREKTDGLHGLYARYASWVGVEAFDAGSVTAVSPDDGIHIDARSQVRLGEALAPRVRRMLEG
jgi:lysophospholipase L1-like esterase